MNPNDVTTAVLDTNIWLDWLMFEEPAVQPLRRAVMAGRLQLLASTRLRAELADVLKRGPLLAQVRMARSRRGLEPEGASAEQALRHFDAVCRMVAEGVGCGLSCSDPDDQHWLDLAVTHRAHWLLTKDRALLKLAGRAKRRFGLTITSRTSGWCDETAQTDAPPTL